MAKAHKLDLSTLRATIREYEFERSIAEHNVTWYPYGADNDPAYKRSRDDYKRIAKRDTVAIRELRKLRG